MIAWIFVRKALMEHFVGLYLELLLLDLGRSLS
uniref:Uncharacterized protein n=1 Tax=Rhizophora mucronata TaxID=61149 RepID=A0A2P2PP88_RHIMU